MSLLSLLILAHDLLWQQSSHLVVIDVVDAMENLRITPTGQAAASSFCKHEVHGMGFLPLLSRFGREPFESRLIPTSEQIAAAPLIGMYGERPALQTWGEDPGIRDQATKCLFQFGATPFEKCMNLTDKDLNYGVVSQSSRGDHMFTWGRFALGSLENKGAEGSVMAATSQAAAAGSNMAMALLRKGVPSSECIIPVVGNTGLAMLFGVVSLLPPSFPIFTPLSKILDISDSKERRVAAAHLQLIREHVYHLGPQVARYTRPVPPPTKMALTCDGIHVKLMNMPVFERGLGLFANQPNNPHDIGPGMLHMVEALNRLHADANARQYVVFPLSIRTPNDELGFYEILYPDLGQQHYIIGCPDRQSDQDCFQLYCDRLFEAVSAVHNAGVIHSDLYPSNIMWRHEEDGTISIKLIDWDASHRIEEGQFCPRAETRLRERFGGNPCFSVDHDLRYLQVLKREYKPDEEDLWRGLSAGQSDDLSSVQQKDIIDPAYFKLFALCHEEETV